MQVVGRTILAAVMISALGSGCTSDAFQAEADVYRLKHLQYYADLIEEYRAETGQVPFEGEEDVSLFVFISHDGQLEHTGPASNNEHVLASFAEWVEVVETGLGREIDEYYEPQQGVYRKPLAYTYRVVDDAYYLSVPLYRSHGFAEQRGPDYYEVTVSNYAGPTNSAWAPEDLFRSAQFQEAIRAPVSRPGFFEEREEEYRRHTKNRPIPVRRRIASTEERLGQLDAVCESTPVPVGSTAGESPNGLRVSEYFIRLQPGGGALYFKEYDLQVPVQDGAIAQRTGEAVARLVEANEYLASEYGFEAFEPFGTSVFPDRGFVTREHLLRTSESNLGVLVRDSFERILRRPVTVKVSEKSIGLRFDAADLTVRDNNSQGVFAEGDEVVVCFRNGASRYDLVIGPSEPTGGISLLAGVPDTVSVGFGR